MGIAEHLAGSLKSSAGTIDGVTKKRKPCDLKVGPGKKAKVGGSLTGVGLMNLGRM